MYYVLCITHVQIQALTITSLYFQCVCIFGGTLTTTVINQSQTTNHRVAGLLFLYLFLYLFLWNLCPFLFCHLQLFVIHWVMFIVFFFGVWRKKLVIFGRHVGEVETKEMNGQVYPWAIHLIKMSQRRKPFDRSAQEILYSVNITCNCQFLKVVAWPNNSQFQLQFSITTQIGVGFPHFQAPNAFSVPRHFGHLIC